MKIKDILNEMKLEVLNIGKDSEIRGGYSSDLLSNVMANAKEGDIWITVQKHMNIIAVAQLKKIPAILIANGGTPSEEVLKKAKEEGITILSSKEGAFELSGKLYNLLIKNKAL